MRQCELLDLCRSSLYYQPKPVSPADLRLMRRIDELHLAHPFLGARRLARMLEREGIEVGRRHVGSLMRLMGIEAIYRKKRTSIPGKLRLPRETYLAVQTIYYPGFAIGGAFGEFGAILATLWLIIVMPFGDVAFWLTLVALVCLLLMHAVFWLVNQPVNKIWLKQQKLGSAGAAFFAAGRESVPGDADWTSLRAQWEYGHVARALLALAALIAVAIALVG